MQPSQFFRLKDPISLREWQSYSSCSVRIALCIFSLIHFPCVSTQVYLRSPNRIPLLPLKNSKRILLKNLFSMKCTSTFPQSGYRGGLHFKGSPKNYVISNRKLLQNSFGRYFGCENVSFVPTSKQIKEFEENGFIMAEKFIDKDVVEKLKSRFEPLFRGEFETGIYPDEWHWREGISLPNVTREICNAWKCDTTIASVVLAPGLGRCAAMLGNWEGARVGQDDIWMKPPNVGGFHHVPAIQLMWTIHAIALKDFIGKEISFHTDCAYIPWPEVTCWIALDDVTKSKGTLEYARGSHKWTKYKDSLNNTFHAPKDHYQYSLQHAAHAEGVEHVDIVPVELPSGGCAFHNGNLWHGSGVNRSDTWRRNLAIHFIPSHSSFQGKKVGYIYGRYKLHNSDHMDETFFPITWTKKGYYSPSVDSFTRKASLGSSS